MFRSRAEQEIRLFAMVNAEFHFEVGSPNAYLSHLLIPETEQRTGAKFRVRANARDFRRTSFFVGEEIFFSKDRLHDVEQKFVGSASSNRD